MLLLKATVIHHMPQQQCPRRCSGIRKKLSGSIFWAAWNMLVGHEGFGHWLIKPLELHDIFLLKQPTENSVAFTRKTSDGKKSTRSFSLFRKKASDSEHMFLYFQWMMTSVILGIRSSCTFIMREKLPLSGIRLCFAIQLSSVLTTVTRLA